MKIIFKKIGDMIKTFFSKHKPIFEAILEVLLVILYVAWAILMLYVFSRSLLGGIEMDSAILVTLAITGYISIIWFTFWITFVNENNKNFHQIKQALWEIRYRQAFNSLEDTLSRLELKISMLEKKMSDNDIKKH